MQHLATETDMDAKGGSARAQAGALLAGLPDRWRHTQAVAARAWSVRETVEPEDREVLMAAAWLHDIGYSAEAEDTGFHPLDGARMAQRRGWPPRVAALIANHSGAAFVAHEAGLDDELEAYPDEHSPVTDALAYADQTTGQRGERLAAADRIAESVRRHGPDSANARAQDVRTPYLLDAVARVEASLTQS
jgi:putative nucleotidyltransferase with HDIG domain